MSILRKIKFKFQEIIYGFSDCDLWNLDFTLAKYILPRLIKFKKINRMSYPSCFKSSEEWHNILDKMIFSFNYIANDRNSDLKNILKDSKKVQKGLELFGKYFQGLWD